MIYHAYIRDIQFNVTTYGSSTPDWLLESFSMEKEIRDRWWQVNPGDYVIDVGAAYGSYTLSALALGAAMVVAFEPSKDEFFDLNSNLIVNNFKGSCRIFNMVVGDSSGVVVDFYPFSHSARPGGPREQKMMTSIDMLTNRYTFPRLDWLKIDVEGYEESVVKGALESIKKYKPTIIVEYHNAYVEGVDEAVRKLLQPLGCVEEKCTGIGRNDSWGKWEWKNG